MSLLVTRVPNMNMLKTQCAWCLRYTLDGVSHGAPQPTKDYSASHGICLDCFAVEMAEMRREFNVLTREDAS